LQKFICLNWTQIVLVISLCAFTQKPTDANAQEPLVSWTGTEVSDAAQNTVITSTIKVFLSQITAESSAFIPSGVREFVINNFDNVTFDVQAQVQKELKKSAKSIGAGIVASIIVDKFVEFATREIIKSNGYGLGSATLAAVNEHTIRLAANIVMSRGNVADVAVAQSMVLLGVATNLKAGLSEAAHSALLADVSLLRLNYATAREIATKRVANGDPIQDVLREYDLAIEALKDQDSRKMVWTSPTSRKEFVKARDALFEVHDSELRDQLLSFSRSKQNNVFSTLEKGFAVQEANFKQNPFASFANPNIAVAPVTQVIDSQTVTQPVFQATTSPVTSVATTVVPSETNAIFQSQVTVSKPVYKIVAPVLSSNGKGTTPPVKALVPEVLKYPDFISGLSGTSVGVARRHTYVQRGLRGHHNYYYATLGAKTALRTTEDVDIPNVGSEIVNEVEDGDSIAQLPVTFSQTDFGDYDYTAMSGSDGRTYSSWGSRWGNQNRYWALGQGTPIDQIPVQGSATYAGTMIGMKTGTLINSYYGSTAGHVVYQRGTLGDVAGTLTININFQTNELGGTWDIPALSFG
jgi:hypothetical protein